MAAPPAAGPPADGPPPGPPPAHGPLSGLTIAVTRAGEQAEDLAGPLRRLGATVVRVPLIAFAPPPDGGAALRRGAASLARYDRVVLTSANGARALVAALPPGADLRGVATAAVGEATASVLRAAGATDVLIGERAVAEGLLAAFAPAAPGQHLALVRAVVARDVLPDGLRALGYEVDVIDAYETVPAPVPPQLRAALAAADVVTFTSPSTVRRYVELVGRPDGLAVISIGPVTTGAAVAAGCRVAATAERADVAGLVDAVVAWAAARPGGPGPAREPGAEPEPGSARG